MIKELVCLLLECSGVPLLIRQTLQRRSITIVTYHRLNPMTADRHFGALRQLYTPISLQSYIDARRNNSMGELPPKSVIVTIDDGDKSIHDLKDVLAKHRMPVTVFLCSGFVGTSRRFWFSAPGLDSAQRQQLKVVPDETRISTLRALGFDHSVEFGERESLDLEEVRDLQALADFQSHSVSHPVLTRCTDEKARDEIVQSRLQLERQLGSRVNAIAYPNGSYSRRETLMAQEAGYQCGLTMDPGFNGQATPMHALKRLALPDECGLHELVVRSCGLWALLRGAKSVMDIVVAAAPFTSRRKGKAVAAS
jgi:peptidoglycan/xylan/chitin deacetylase (PgdA/CDA1 family)